MYFNGDGVETNRLEAAKWYRMSAEQGFAEAQYNLGMMYYNGDGVETNKLEAAKWYRKAADQGNIRAQFQISKLYALGEGVERDVNEAAKWRLKVIEQLKKRSCNLNAKHGNEKVGKSEDFNQKRDWKWGFIFGYTVLMTLLFARILNINLSFVDLTTKGLGYLPSGSVCCLLIALIISVFIHGILINWNDEFRNFTGEETMLTDNNEHGTGDENYTTEAVKLVRKIANRNCDFQQEAMRRLGDFYANGLGVEKDFAEAIKWRLKAWWLRCRTMVVLFGTPGCLLMILITRWLFFIRLRKRARCGDIIATLKVARRYEEERDDEEAMKWYRKAAEQGNAEAQYRLGRFYERGWGVVKDEAEAMKWYRKAAEQGYQYAIEHLEELKKKDSP